MYGLKSEMNSFSTDSLIYFPILAGILDYCYNKSKVFRFLQSPNMTESKPGIQY